MWCCGSSHTYQLVAQTYAPRVARLIVNLFPHAKEKAKEKADGGNDDYQLKPAELALGVVKIFLKDIQLHEQPLGKYFCVFK